MIPFNVSRLLINYVKNAHQPQDNQKMLPTKPRRKPDFFAVLVLAVTLGVSATLAYQLYIYGGGDELPLAQHTPPPSLVGG